MMTHEPCHGRVAREEQQHDRRVASLDLEESACGQPAFVAFCQSAFAFLQVLHCLCLCAGGLLPFSPQVPCLPPRDSRAAREYSGHQDY